MGDTPFGSKSQTFITGIVWHHDAMNVVTACVGKQPGCGPVTLGLYETLCFSGKLSLLVPIGQAPAGHQHPFELQQRLLKGAAGICRSCAI